MKRARVPVGPNRASCVRTRQRQAEESSFCKGVAAPAFGPGVRSRGPWRANRARSGRINKLSRTNRRISHGTELRGSDNTEPKGSDNKELSTSPFED